MERTLSLSFSCCGCDSNIDVKLKCTGPRLNDPDLVAAVNVICPTCGATIQLLFEPRGVVREVRPFRLGQPTPEPSLN